MLLREAVSAECVFVISVSRSYGVRSRKEGNIHRFSADDEDDEDMSTWNGNSTQQLWCEHN